MGRKGKKSGGYDAEEAPVAAEEEENKEKAVEDESGEEEETSKGGPKAENEAEEIEPDDYDNWYKAKAKTLARGNEQLESGILSFMKKDGKKVKEGKEVKSSFSPVEIDGEKVLVEITVQKEDGAFLVTCKSSSLAAASGADASADVAAKPTGPLDAPFRPHNEYPPITGAIEVVYSPYSGLPPDFCQFAPTWDKDKPWCMKNFPEYYPELCETSLEEAEKKAVEAAEKSKMKELPGGKKKREASPSVTIKKLSRGGRKCVTSVSGLDGFGVKLDDVAKLFKKKFACGCSVVAGENGAPDSVDIQGDFEYEVVEILEKEYKSVPADKVVLMEGGTKKKGKGK